MPVESALLGSMGCLLDCELCFIKWLIGWGVSLLAGLVLGAFGSSSHGSCLFFLQSVWSLEVVLVE